MRLALALGIFLGLAGCAAHAPVPVETVGTLSAGSSIWTAPVHETTPPPSFEIAGSADDDDAAPVVTAADAGPDAAPAIEEKNAHGF